jgi:hypothetical protein
MNTFELVVSGQAAVALFAYGLQWLSRLLFLAYPIRSRPGGACTEAAP